MKTFLKVFIPLIVCIGIALSGSIVYSDDRHRPREYRQYDGGHRKYNHKYEKHKPYRYNHRHHNYNSKYMIERRAGIYINGERNREFIRRHGYTEYIYMYKQGYHYCPMSGGITLFIPFYVK